MQPRFTAKKTLRAKRHKIGLQVKEMAETVTLLTGKKMSLSRYEKVERGQHTVSLHEAIMICKIFPDVQISELWREAKSVEKVTDIPENRTVIHRKNRNEKKE